MVNSVKSERLGTVTNGLTPRSSCDDLDIDVCAVVGTVMPGKFLPYGICAIGAVAPLSCCVPCSWRPVGTNIELEVVAVEFFSV